jgi:hypothetical protein
VDFSGEHGNQSPPLFYQQSWISPLLGGRVATVKAIIGGTVEVAAEEAMEGVIVEEEGEVAVEETIRATTATTNATTIVESTQTIKEEATP